MSDLNTSLRVQFPKASGFFEGSGVALIAIAVLAIFGGTSAAWPLVIIGLLGFRRSISYQVAALLPAALIYMVLGDIVPREVFLPLGAGLLLANAVPLNENTHRWSSEHCLYAMALVVGFFPASLLLRGTSNLLAEIAQTFLLSAVVIAILAIISACRVLWRMLRNEQDAQTIAVGDRVRP